ncbi:ribonuclease HI family protein [Rothia halotolerans]|uniref:ribonuclease HI family protein n=1 Tax=Rothia halotolerans TaxID=405770 RepID=UPI00101C4554|nr:ribonuclease HI family protein [Rothia halotolerans]
MAAKQRSTEPITAAADGSALGNPGPAGWAWYVDERTWRAGGWPHGTNNMGELQAVLDLLRATADEPERELHILCDSQYVINCITRWMQGWKRKGWKKKDGKPVLNRDILEALDAALAGRRYTFEWVKGHAGHPLNEAADERARAAATAFRDGREPDQGPGFGAGPAGPADSAGPARSSGAGNAVAGTEGRGAGAPEVEAPLALFEEPSGATTSSAAGDRTPAPASAGEGEGRPAAAPGPAGAPERAERSPAGEPGLEELRALEAELAGAAVYADPARLESLVAPELTWITWRGKLTDRATALRYPEKAFGLEGEPEVVRVERAGERAGLVISRIPARGGRVLRSSLWRAEAGGWVLAHRQDTPAL